MIRWWIGCAIILLGVVLLLVGKGKDGSLREAPLSVTEILGTVPPEGFARAVSQRRFTFPEDHGPHPDFRNEWWYFTGNLRAADGRRFGYQLTFFRTALVPRLPERKSRWAARDIYLAHFAVTDVERGRLYASERFGRAALGLAGAGGSPLKIHLDDWSVRETGGYPWSVVLAAHDGGHAIDLVVRSAKPPVLNGEKGLSLKSATTGNASYYYSITRMETGGSIRIGNDTFRVSGLTWFDREWGTSALEGGQTGWDWFSLQLDDGRDLMVYRLRRSDGSADPFSGGTIVAANGVSRWLKAEEVDVEVTRSWRSAASGVAYPARWRLKVPREGLDLDVVPLVPDQELLLSVHYWEGAVRAAGISGSPGGSGYVELTGYGGGRKLGGR